MRGTREKEKNREREIYRKREGERERDGDERKDCMVAYSRLVLFPLNRWRHRLAFMELRMSLTAFLTEPFI